MKRGFTLIELLVAIAIVGVLSSVVLVSLNQARANARDAKRKADLKEIAVALELYRDKNGSYPNTGGTTPVQGTPQNTYSTMGSSWLSALVTDGQLKVAPKDPINVDQGPWCFAGATSRNTIYTYISDGNRYILCGWLENPNDKATLQFADVPNPWNPTQGLRANHNYSNYSIVYAQW